MLLKTFSIIMSLRTCILRPIWENLDGFVIKPNSFEAIGSDHTLSAPSWESDHNAQPYINSFYSDLDIYNDHLQYLYSLDGPFHNGKERQLSSDYQTHSDFNLPSLDSKINNSYDHSDDFLQEYLDYLENSSMSLTPVTETEHSGESSTHTNKDLTIREATARSPFMNFCHQNTSPHAEVISENVNIPINPHRENLEPQIHTSTTSASNGKSMSDDVSIVSPPTGKKRAYESLEQDTSPRKEKNPRGHQEHYTAEAEYMSVPSQNQHNQCDPSNQASSLDQNESVDRVLLDHTLVSLILNEEVKNHMIHGLTDPKNYKSLSAVNAIYGAAHHGNLIIKDHPSDFNEMNQFWTKGNLYILNLRKRWFPNFPLNIESPFIWKLKKIIFPILILKVNWTYDLFKNIQNDHHQIQKSKSLIYKSVCKFFINWFKNLINHYQFNWLKILKSGACYDDHTKDFGASPENLYDITLHLEFGTRRSFWGSLTWEIYERWLQEFDKGIYSCIISPVTHQSSQNLKKPYGYNLKKSMILEQGPYSKPEFEKYVS
ncbi:hypothetical protein DFH28DRAFT_881620 [Melampsora americana]|nr:hypothetical protein DFH28DRAFT_881620 [Melampsora americana]